MENQPNATVFVQHYGGDGDITTNTANTTCHFIERTTGKLYTPRDLPAGSPVWLEYYDNEQDCNYYQHSVTKQKVWTVEDIDAAEEESQHSIGVAFSREKKSSSPPRSPARRGNSRLLNNSTKKSKSKSSSKSKENKNNKNSTKNTKNTKNTKSTKSTKGIGNTTKATDTPTPNKRTNRHDNEREQLLDTTSLSSSSPASSISSDQSSDSSDHDQDRRSTPRPLQTSPPRGRHGQATATQHHHHHVSFDPAIQDVATPSKNKLRTQKGASETSRASTTAKVAKNAHTKHPKKHPKKHQHRRKTKQKKKYRALNKQKQFDHDGSVTFALYTFMVFFHGALCESPAAVLESVVRCVVSFSKGLVHATASLTTTRENAWAQAVYEFRESLLFLCVLPSLLLLFPGGLVYRSFDPLEPWEVNSIWTIVGRVDPRRLSAFTFGQGSDATNVLSNRFPHDAMDDLPMPSAVSTSNYRRVSIGDGVPSDARRRRKATRSNKKKRRVVSSSSSDESSDSDDESSGESSGSGSGSDDSEDFLNISSSSSEEEEERSSLREVVLELPVMARSSRHEKGARGRGGEERWVSSV